MNREPWGDKSSRIPVAQYLNYRRCICRIRLGCYGTWKIIYFKNQNYSQEKNASLKIKEVGLSFRQNCIVIRVVRSDLTFFGSFARWLSGSQKTPILHRHQNILTLFCFMKIFRWRQFILWKFESLCVLAHSWPNQNCVVGLVYRTFVSSTFRNCQ